MIITIQFVFSQDEPKLSGNMGGEGVGIRAIGVWLGGVGREGGELRHG